MIINKTINAKYFQYLLVGFISYGFGVLCLQYQLKAFILFGLIAFAIFFFSKMEYAFYFLLAGRSFIDVFYLAEAAGDIRVTQYVGILTTVLFLTYLIF